MPRLLLVTALLAATALAGCSSTGNGTAFDVTPPAAPGGAYAFEASVSADNYTWDLGDHLTTLYGKSVSHAYDFTNGKITVVLHAKTGKDTKDYSQSLILGTGKNDPATFLFESSSNWTIPGETVTFSARGSHDPEADPLRFSWSCNYVQAAEKKPIHTHPSYGVPFATTPAGSVTSGLARSPLPPADVTYPGDFCDAMGTGTAPSTHATTIAGKFAKTGVYDIYLIAADPAHPTTSGSFRIVVSAPGDRPEAVLHFAYGDGQDLKGGSGGSLQGVCSQLNQGTCDQFSERFSLPLNGLGGNATLTFDAGNGLNQVGFAIKHGSAQGADVVSGNAAGTFTFNGANLGVSTDPSFTVLVTLKQGAQVKWALDVHVALDRDPAKVFF
jgi:hypothetical protein